MKGVVNEAGETLKAGCVVINNDQVLLVTNRHNGMWGLPKGHVEPGEEAKAAAERETFEETGYRVLAVAEISDRHYLSQHTGRTIHGRYWLARLVSQQAGEDFVPEEECRWFAVDDAEAVLTAPNVRLISEALSRLALEKV